MTKGWQIKPLGSVAVVFDGPHATPKTVNAGPIFLGIGALQDGTINLGETRHVTQEDYLQWTRRVRPQVDDVVFSYETRLGQAAIIPPGLTCCLGRRMGLVRFNTEAVLPQFFLYQYMAPAFQSFLDSQTIRGATVDRISIKGFPSFPIAIPSGDEQRRLVAILDKAFAGITTAKANAETNLQNAHQWAARQLATAVSAASTMGRIEKLEKLVAPSCTLSYGIVQPGDEVPGGLPVVRPVDLGDKTVHADGLKRIDPALARSYARTTLEGNDLLLCVRGTTGTVAIAEPALAGANVTRGIVPVRFDPQSISQALGYYLLRSEPVQAQVRAKTYGTALMQINIGDLRKIVVAVPPPEQQAALVERLDAIQEAADQLTDVYRRKLAALDELKRSLLHQAFSGGLS